MRQRVPGVRSDFFTPDIRRQSQAELHRRQRWFSNYQIPRLPNYQIKKRPRFEALSFKDDACLLMLRVVLLAINLARQVVLLAVYLGFLCRGQAAAVFCAHLTRFLVQFHFLVFETSGFARGQ
jgi:hypothetical protein